MSNSPHPIAAELTRDVVTSVALLPLPAVLARVGLSRSSVYALIAAGKFPAPVKIGVASRWASSQIDAWIAGAVQTGKVA